jgi:hypothetical protein
LKTSLDNLENTMLDIKQSVVTRFLLKNDFPPGIINLNKIQKNMTCEEYSRYVHALHSDQTSNFITYYKTKKIYMKVKSFFQKKY